MKILHIASFHGNIGDNANHKGFRKLLSDRLKSNIEFFEVEIRDFYSERGISSFNDKSFIQKCNKHDLVIIGGGNYFEINWEYSSTGTTIDITNKSLEMIKPPILFNLLGFDDYKGTSKSNILKFESFLRNIIPNEKYFVSLRNDGSIDNFKRLISREFHHKILEAPDGAFNVNYDLVRPPFISIKRKYIGLNIVKDFIEIRYNSVKHYKKFIIELKEVIEKFLENHPNHDIIMFSHVPKDIQAISDFITNFNDQFLRKRIIIAPFLSGPQSDEYVFGMYNVCDLIIGMRFHSNVVAISQNIPTIALSSFKKINKLYEGLDLKSNVLNISEANFKNNLEDMLSTINLEKVAEKLTLINKNIYFKSTKYIDKVAIWLMKFNIV